MCTGSALAGVAGYGQAGAAEEEFYESTVGAQTGCDGGTVKCVLEEQVCSGLADLV